MQLNPFLLSIAAPVAAKSMQTVAHAAHEVGQGFLKTLTMLGNPATKSESASGNSLESQLAVFASSFRSWLQNQGVTGPFEMQFHLADNGDPISSVVGPESSEIVDLVYSNDALLQRLTSLAELAQAEQERTSDTLPGLSRPARLTIASDDAYVVRDIARTI